MSESVARHSENGRTGWLRIVGVPLVLAAILLAVLGFNATATHASVSSGHALEEYSGDFSFTGEALENAPADIGFGAFINTTSEPVTVTGLSVVAPNSGIKEYREWTANLCSDEAFVGHVNGDPRLPVNTGLSNFHVYRFQPITVPPKSVRPSVPTGEGPTCVDMRGESPLYYMYELIPSKSGARRSVKGFDVSYTWSGRFYTQYEPFPCTLLVKAHKYWKGAPSLSQFWGRGLPYPIPAV